jgi:hypothetical protein
MNLHLGAFALGINDLLQEKRGGADFLDHAANENILPTISSQSKWRYVQTPEGLKITDGNKVFGFGLNDFGGETSRVPKLEDTGILDFEKNKITGGTAQIHRSSPDSIYMTLSNGRENPTFRLEHDEGRNWKYIPNKKMINRLKAMSQQLESTTIPSVDPNSLLAAANEKSAGISYPLDLDSSTQLVTGGINGVKNIGSFLGSHPMATILGALGVGGLIHQLRKNQSPGYKHKVDMDPSIRMNNTFSIPLLSGMALAGGSRLLSQ